MATLLSGMVICLSIELDRFLEFQYHAAAGNRHNGFKRATLGGRFVFGQQIAWGFLNNCLVLCSALVWAFCGLGLWVSTSVQNSARATMYLLLIWVAGIALLDFALAGMMLQWRLEPRVVFAVAALNPVQSIRMALLSSADPELSVLGPVGFYLANRIGSTWLYVLGLGWPLLLGAIAWSGALWKLRRGDVV